MCQAAKEVVWLTYRVLEKHWYSLARCTSLTHNPVFHPRPKRIATRDHYIRDLVQDDQVMVKYISTKIMIAGVLTRFLSRPRHATLIEIPGVYESQRTTKGGVRDRRLLMGSITVLCRPRSLRSPLIELDNGEVHGSPCMHGDPLPLIIVPTPRMTEPG